MPTPLLSYAHLKRTERIGLEPSISPPFGCARYQTCDHQSAHVCKTTNGSACIPDTIALTSTTADSIMPKLPPCKRTFFKMMLQRYSLYVQPERTVGIYSKILSILGSLYFRPPQNSTVASSAFSLTRSSSDLIIRWQLGHKAW